MGRRLIEMEWRASGAQRARTHRPPHIYMHAYTISKCLKYLAGDGVGTEGPPEEQDVRLGPVVM